MTHYDEASAAREAHYTAQNALLDLAASAIREAFIARASDGLQLALDLTVTTERHRLRSALPMIAYDATSRQLGDVLVGVCNALRGGRRWIPAFAGMTDGGSGVSAKARHSAPLNA